MTSTKDSSYLIHIRFNDIFLTKLIINSRTLNQLHIFNSNWACVEGERKKISESFVGCLSLVNLSFVFLFSCTHIWCKWLKNKIAKKTKTFRIKHGRAEYTEKTFWIFWCKEGHLTMLHCRPIKKTISPLTMGAYSMFEWIKVHIHCKFIIQEGFFLKTLMSINEYL